MGKTSSGVKVMNYIRSKASRQYQDVVPVATIDNIQSLGGILLNDAYTPYLNEFVNTLINRIALTIVRNKSFNNPLAILKKGSTPLGTDIQEIYENPAEAKPYEYSDTAMAQLLKITDPDTHVAYYRLNRRDKYTKTITREGLQGAFTSWDNFESFISSITQSLYSGNYIDEFKYTKQLVDGAYDNNKIITEVVSPVTDKDTAEAFLEKCRYLYTSMSFPSSDFNAYSKFSGANGTITTWTDPERVVLLVRADVMAKVDVKALASAFNMDKADFLGRVITIDKFENDAILGVIADDSFFQIYDNIFRFDEFYNANTMAWNEYLHAWGTYAISPFANAVALVTAEPTPATAIALDNNAYSVEEEATKSVSVTLTPAGATSNVEFESSDASVFTIAKVSDASATITGVGAGSGTLTAVTDNGLKATATVTVTDGE